MLGHPGHGEGSFEGLFFPEASAGTPLALPYSWYSRARLFVTAHTWLLLHPSSGPLLVGTTHAALLSWVNHSGFVKQTLPSRGSVGSLCRAACLEQRAGASWAAPNAVSEGGGTLADTGNLCRHCSIALCIHLFTISSHACWSFLNRLQLSVQKAGKQTSITSMTMFHSYLFYTLLGDFWACFSCVSWASVELQASCSFVWSLLSVTLFKLFPPALVQLC